ncbi:hypothetical protein AK830_g2852 [Neonectria ditissima]|uniref:Uncharacterized protein n=1 Tax=Neonectria ditissima TaxID=78410 RepID=A0A0N8H863_9HYPO|nr:hypothetical protein AK830_g2852 [Neonectria ditissima]
MRFSIIPTLVLGAMVPYAACVDVVKTEKAQYVSNTRACEKNVKVPNHSGFIKVGEDNEESKMWFYVAESRQLSSERNLVIYLGGGGPGMAASYAMLDGSGPCVIDPKRGRTTTNQFSINEWTDVLYVDSPVNTGFSKGNSYIDTTETATEYMMEFLGQFFKEFPRYKWFNIGLWGVDYGAHLATSVGATILKKNEQCLKRGQCEPGYSYIRLQSLGLDSPRLDLTLQHKAAIDYAADNDYVEIITEKDRDALQKEFVGKYEARWNKCGSAKYMDCEEEVGEHKELWKKLVEGVGHRRLGRKVDEEDVRRPRKDDSINYQVRAMQNSKEARHLNQTDVQKNFGIFGGDINDKKVNYVAFNLEIHDKFWASQDVIRSSLADLEYVVKHGTRTLILGGDADIITNHIGLRRIAESLNWSGQKRFKEAKYSALPVPRARNGDKDPNAMFESTDVGLFKTVDNLTLMKIQGVGHHVGKRKPAYLAYIVDKHGRGNRF